MSRSRKKSPVTTACGPKGSDKSWKRQVHSALRTAEREALTHSEEPPMLREVSDPWDSAHDGKLPWGAISEKEMRK